MEELEDKIKLLDEEIDQLFEEDNYKHRRKIEELVWEKGRTQRELLKLKKISNGKKTGETKS